MCLPDGRKVCIFAFESSGDFKYDWSSLDLGRKEREALPLNVGRILNLQEAIHITGGLQPGSLCLGPIAAQPASLTHPHL